MWTGVFWSAVAERALKTAAQSAFSLLAVDVTGVLDVNWAGLGSAVGLATLLSVLSSVASGVVDPASGPSLGPEVLRGDTGPPADPGGCPEM